MLFIIQLNWGNPKCMRTIKYLKAAITGQAKF